MDSRGPDTQGIGSSLGTFESDLLPNAPDKDDAVAQTRWIQPPHRQNLSRRPHPVIEGTPSSPGPGQPDKLLRHGEGISYPNPERGRGFPRDRPHVRPEIRWSV